MSSFRLGSTVLATSWQPFLHPSIVALEFPPVPRIDCANCWMANLGFFQHHIKCCHTSPAIPNFLVGEILAHAAGTVGEQRIRQWLSDRRGDPFQIHTPPKLAEQFEKKYDDLFEKPGCPLLDERGFCTIHEHRPPLCLGYHCLYPHDNPAMMAFWNCLGSLLQLHVAVAGSFLLEKLKLDTQRYQAFWKTVTLNTMWEGDTVRPEISKELWQDKDPETFYLDCYQYIEEHRDTIREDLIAYRNEQLLLFLEKKGQLLPERKTEIESQSHNPHEIAPPPDALTLFMRHNLVYFEEHVWTIQENERCLLWFHEQAFAADKSSSASVVSS